MAGTPIRTPVGSKPIDAFVAGDILLSRCESEPGGVVETKAVEKVFRRIAPVLHLHLGGQVIRLTAEHPFFVYAKGWQPAGDLASGDRLLAEGGRWIVVEEVFQTDEWEEVYNLRIADHHTFFVGSADWQFAVWVHNVC